MKFILLFILIILIIMKWLILMDNDIRDDFFDS